MFEYGHVDNDQVGQIERLPAALPVDHPKLVSGALRIVVNAPDFDPVTEVRGEFTGFVIEAGQILRMHAVRVKNSGEIAGMIAAKDAAIEAEFDRLHSLPIAFAVAGVSYDWHADAKAVENIMGLAILAVGGLAQNPRNWTPVGSATPVADVNVVHLGAAIAARRDALFAVKKAKQAVVAGMSDPAAVAAYDVAAGW